MKIRILLFAFLPMVLGLVTSCEKEDDVVIKTKTELIMMGSWKFQSATASGTDVSNNPSLTCFKDNTMVFTSTTAGSIDEGVTVCSPTTAGPFTWSLTTNETVLNISTTIIPGGSSAFTLVSINETNLVVSQVVNGINLVVTFKH